MSIEVIKQVAEAEQMALERKQEAAALAKKTVSDAQQAGLDLLGQSRASAEAQVQAWIKQAQEQAANDQQTLTAETARACDALRASAQQRLAAAADFIVRRVVQV